MHPYTIYYYCCRHQYFMLCALQVINFIIFSIQLNIIGNIEVREFVCFELIQFSYNLTFSVFLMHSHSYFITNIHYFHLRFYHIPTTILPWSRTLNFWNNCQHSQGKSIFSVQTDTKFWALHVNTTMHDYTIDNYCYC